MKIKMLSERYYPIWGGAENQLRQLIPYLSRKQCDIVVITRRWQKKQSRYEYVDGTKIFRVGLPGEGKLSTISFVASLCWYLIKRSESIDVIHTHGAVAMGALGSFIAKVTGKICVAKIATAGRITDMHERILGRLLLFWLKKSNAIVCISGEIQSELSKTHVHRRSIYQIKNAVDTNRFKPSQDEKKKLWRKSHGFQENVPIAVFSGRIVPRKGLDVLIDAWQCVIKDFSNAHLFIIGSGNNQPDSIEVQMKFKVKSEIISNIHFVGETHFPESYLSVADIFVFPSKQEGFPNALLEAMACELSPVASNIGGVVDIIKNDETGLLFPSGDSQAMADRIQYLLANPETRYQIGQKARSHVLQNYTFERVAGQYCQLYESIYQ